MSQQVSMNLSTNSNASSCKVSVDLNSSMSDAYETMSSDSASVGFNSSSEGGMISSSGTRYSSSCDEELESDYSGPRLDTEHGKIQAVSFTRHTCFLVIFLYRTISQSHNQWQHWSGKKWNSQWRGRQPHLWSRTELFLPTLGLSHGSVRNRQVCIYFFSFILFCLSLEMIYQSASWQWS